MTDDATPIVTVLGAEPDEIARILTELARPSPHREETFWVSCRFCHGHGPNVTGMPGFMTPIPHSDTCAWMGARRLLGMNIPDNHTYAKVGGTPGDVAEVMAWLDDNDPTGEIFLRPEVTESVIVNKVPADEAIAQLKESKTKYERDVTDGRYHSRAVGPVYRTELTDGRTGTLDIGPSKPFDLGPMPGSGPYPIAWWLAPPAAAAVVLLIVWLVSSL